MLERQPRAKRHLRADDAMPAVKAMLDAEHVHRPALALGNSGSAPGQFGHDHFGINAIGKHVAVVAIASNDAVAPDLHCRLQSDGNRFLADIEVAEAADQAEAI